MDASDMLRQARSTGYGAKSGGGGDETGSRSFPLTPEEVQAIGDKSDCIKVYGSSDGKTYSIERVEPDNVQSGPSEVMVKTPTQISPS